MTGSIPKKEPRAGANRDRRRCWHSMPADGDLLAVIEAARLLVKEF